MFKLRAWHLLLAWLSPAALTAPLQLALVGLAVPGAQRGHAPTHAPLWSQKRHKSSEPPIPAVFCHPSRFKDSSASPISLTPPVPDPKAQGGVQRGWASPLQFLLLFPRNLIWASRPVPPPYRSLPSLSAKGAWDPWGGSSISTPSHPSNLLSAEEAPAHVTEPRGPVDTVDTDT